MDFNNARVLLTGGSSGIGYETARLLREKGAQVVICGRHEETIQKAAGELDVFGFRADVSNEADIDALFAFTLEKLGGLDILINNAGLGHIAPLVDTSLEDFQRIWEVNTKSTFLCGQKAARVFIGQNSGNIINVSSMGAVKGFPNGSAYVASKAAITGLTMCWQAELRRHNVRVTQINPSEVITAFGEKIGFENTNTERKLKGLEIAQAIVGVLAISDIGFVPEISVWATNPG